jgi:transcription termination factor NusB
MNGMTTEDDDTESQVLREMFEEIMKLIREKQIKLEAIIQSMTDQDKISQDVFNRIYRVLTEHGKKKQWL